MESDAAAGRHGEETEARASWQEELLLLAYRMSGSLTFADRLAGVAGGPGEADAPDGDAAPDGVDAPGEADARDGADARALREAADLCVEALAGGRAPALEPFPDGLLPDSALTGSRYEPRESVSLEFVEALRALEPARRAALLLCDVLGMGEEHAAGADLAAAREAFARTYRQERGRREPPGGQEAAELGMTYIFNWEAADLEGLGAMLAAGAEYLEHPEGSRAAGRGEVLARLSAGPFAEGRAGRWRLLPTRANGQLAFAAYELEARRKVYGAHSMHVVGFRGREVAEVRVFGQPWLFKLFRLPDEFIAQGRTAD